MDLWWLVQWLLGLLCGWLIWGRNRYNSVSKLPVLKECYGFYVYDYGYSTNERDCVSCKYHLQCVDKTRALKVVKAQEELLNG